jgi:hypothetical protein
MHQGSLVFDNLRSPTERKVEVGISSIYCSAGAITCTGHVQALVPEALVPRATAGYDRDRHTVHL